MTKFVVDLSLIAVKSSLLMTSKEHVFESLLTEHKIRFEKYYSSCVNRNIKSAHGRYIYKDEKITIYEFSCADSLYDFIIYLFKKQVNNLDILNKSWS